MCALFSGATAFAGRALACGASAGGAAGVSACSLSEHLEASRLKWRVGASYAYTSTAIRFNEGLRFDQTRNVAFATVDYRYTPAWTFEVGAGSLVGGTFSTGAESYDFTPGLLGAIGASWRVLDADGARPFVAFTGQLAFVAASTRPSGQPSAESTGYHALDLRIGALAGWPLWELLTPYALARAFGGPVYWRYQGASLTGGDVHHFQIGGGVLFRIGRTFDLFAEGVPLGELGISAGAGVAF